uniref:Cyclin-dependent kinase 20 n=1 Tax=Strigamia maritima TaxID=126957 RepID=T1ISK1_STRMM
MSYEGMNRYSVLGWIGEGSQGIVLKGKDLQNGDIVALKRITLKKVTDGIPLNLLREIKALQMIDSDYIVKLLEVFSYGAGFVLVFEFMQSDLAEVLRDFEVTLNSGHVKSYMQMLLKGVAHCHSLGVIHRDLKPANLLISSNGMLKIADFGLARLYTKDEIRPYSHRVATRWYRAPELLYGANIYNEGMDLWAVGCIFGEMLNYSPVFPGENDINQLSVVLQFLGTPTEESWPGMTQLPDYNKIEFPKQKAVPFEEIFQTACSEAIDLLKKFLVYASNTRIPAEKALVHPYFFVKPLAVPPSQLPRPVRRPRTTHPGPLGDFDVLRPLEIDLVSPILVEESARRD